MRKLAGLLLICFAVNTYDLCAQTSEETAVSRQVELLRKLLVLPDQTALEEIAADALTYGHSTGLLEDKSAFIDHLVTGKTQFIDARFSDQSISISGDVAVVRNRFVGNPVANPELKIDIIVLMVWQNQKGQWKLLARQGAKTPN